MWDPERVLATMQWNQSSFYVHTGDDVASARIPVQQHVRTGSSDVQRPPTPLLRGHPPSGPAPEPATNLAAKVRATRPA
jgi:hypothetical protein